MNRLSLVLLLLSGCLSNNSLDTMTMAENNISNLSRISVGMNESEVMCIMHKPYSKETILYEGNTFDFWFYVTRPTGLDQNRLLHHNLTPLAFKNGVLIGWGFNYYNHIVRQEKIEAKQKTPVPEEDVNLEKVLQAPPSKDGNPAKQPPAQQKPAPQTPPPSAPKKQQPAPKQPPQQAPAGEAPPQPRPLELGPPSSTPKPSTSRYFLPLSRFTAQASDPEPSQERDPKRREREKKEDKAKKAPPSDEKREYLGDEDRRMIERENEQNFDFW